MVCANSTWKLCEVEKCHVYSQQELNIEFLLGKYNKAREGVSAPLSFSLSFSLCRYVCPLAYYYTIDYFPCRIPNCNLNVLLLILNHTITLKWDTTVFFCSVLCLHKSYWLLDAQHKKNVTGNWRNGKIGRKNEINWEFVLLCVCVWFYLFICCYSTQLPWSTCKNKCITCWLSMAWQSKPIQRSTSHMPTHLKTNYPILYSCAAKNCAADDQKWSLIIIMTLITVIIPIK